HHGAGGVATAQDVRQARQSTDTEITMSAAPSDLSRKHCKPCEGGVPVLSPAEIEQYLKDVPEWKLSADGKRIRREWRVKDFVTALDFFNRIGQIAEAEDHHPDLHLVGDRN